jgi:ribose transport system permease protein
MQNDFRARLTRGIELRELLLLVLIALVIIVMSFASPFFLSLSNFRAMAAGLVPTGIIVVGMTYLLVCGGFDLSVGSVLALASTICAYLLTLGWGIPEAVVATLVVGAVFGVANGLLVTGLGINPLIATLGSMSVARGIALIMTEGFSLSKLPKSFGLAGNSEVLGMPLIVWIMLLVVVVGDIGLRRTTYFRQVYFIGNNEQAARLSGINVSAVRVTTYALAGVLAALAGVLLASRLMSGTPTAGNGLELQVLAAAVIGGASLKGGEGTVFGAFLGAVFMALVNNAMTMLAVSIYWQMLVTGVILVAAVGIDMIGRRRRAA